nr:zinc finger FYVE domain containing protein 9 [Hymenolepis microstoma]
MNGLVDLDKLLNDFQEQEAVSRACVKQYNFIENKSDDGYACLIGINPTVSKPFCLSVSPHSSGIKEITYLDKTSMDKCTFPESQDSNCSLETIESLQQSTFSSTLPVYNRDEHQISSDARSFHETHRVGKSLSQLAPVDRSSQDLFNYSSSLKNKSDVKCTISPVQEGSVNPAKKLQRSSESEQIGLVGEVGLSSREVSPLRDPIELNEADHNDDEAEGINITPSPQSGQNIPPLPSPVASQSPLSSLSPPEWAADTSSSVCVSCGAKFTVLRRRHHCRICGRLLCATCTPHRVPLPPSFSNHIPLSPSSPEGSLLRLVGSGSSSTNGASGEVKLHRVCIDCFRNFFGGSLVSSTVESVQQQYVTTTQAPTPTNPSGMIPTIEVEAPSIMASPTVHPPLERRILPAFALQQLKDEGLLPLRNTESSSSKSLWPPLVVSTNPELVLETDVSEDRIMRLLSSDDRAVTFAITRNLHIRASISVNGEFWSFISHGLYSLGQEEICLLLRRRNGESLPPIDVLWYYHLLYQLAFSQDRGIKASHRVPSTPFPFEHGSCLLLPTLSKHQQNDHEQQVSEAPWFGGGCYGFLFIHAVEKQMETLSFLIGFFPQPPFLFAVLLRSPTEVDLATLQPLRLLLALNLANRGSSVPISDRDRCPVFESTSTSGNSVLSLCNSGGLAYISIPEMNILSSGLDNSQGEIKLQILLRRSCHESVRRSLNLAAHGGNLLCLGGGFCPNADCHLAVADSSTGPITKFTPPISSARNNLVVGASFIILRCGGGRSSLSIVEDGFVAHLTKEQFKAILVHMNRASSMQLRIESTQPLPESLLSLLPDSEHPPTSNNGALITLNWVNESVPMHPTSLHYSCINGRSVEPRRTFIIPPEHQLRHWLIRHRLSDPEAFTDPSPTPLALPRVAWTRLHSLADRPVYAVDNRSGEVLDCFAVFNAVSATFINAIFPHAALLRKANHRSISLRILLQPPNTFNFFIGSNMSPLTNQSIRQIEMGLSRYLEDSDWWKVDNAPIGQEGAWSPPRPLISEPAYVNGVDSAMIPLLDGLVHNISCSWFFDDAQEQSESAMIEEDGLTAPGLLLEFDFDLLD